MAFPASGQLLADALRGARNLATRLKVASVDIRTRSAAGPINRQDVVIFMGALSDAISQWGAISALPGIGQYARDQLGNQSLDLAAEFSAMVGAAVALKDWIFANFPKDAGGAWLLESVDANGVRVPLTFTAASLAQFRTNCSAFEATIA